MNMAHSLLPMFHGAMLVFDVDLETASEFDLQSDDAQWSRVVHACRTSNIANLPPADRLSLANSDVVRGPIVANCDDIERRVPLSKAPRSAMCTWVQYSFTATSGVALLDLRSQQTIVRSVGVLRFDH